MKRLAVVVGSVMLGGCTHQSLTSRNVQPPASGVTDTLHRQVKNAADLGDGDLEGKQLRAKLDANPADTAARLELAKHYQKRGFRDIAIEHCRLAVERDPQSVEAHIALARLLRDDNRAAEGAELLAKFEPSHADNVEIEAWLGLLLDEAGDWKAGEKAHRRAVALAPDRDDLHNNLGFCLLEQGKKKEAAEEFRAALKINSNSVVARNNLAGIVSGDAKEAIANLQSVASPADAHNNLAALLIEQGKYTDARRELDAALGYNRQHAAALKNLQLLSELDGKPTEFRPAPRGNARLSAMARLRRVWRRLRGQEDHDSGAALASR